MTTTQPDVANDPQAVIDAVVASWQAFNDAKLDPWNDVALESLDDYRGGELLVTSIELIGRYRSENQRAVTNEQSPAILVPDPTTVQFGEDRRTAVVASCRVNSNILVETGGNADGSDRVVDDSISVFVETAEVEFIDGRWVETGGQIIERFEGATRCDE